jgi:hypothetical protein
MPNSIVAIGNRKSEIGNCSTAWKLEIGFPVLQPNRCIKTGDAVAGCIEKCEAETAELAEKLKPLTSDI